MIRTFASLFFATATALLGLGIISPILPLYANTFSATGFEIGLVFAAFSISRALLGPFVGRLSDRVGRKPLILLGLGGYALVSILYASSAAIWQLGLYRLLQGVFSVMVTPLAQAFVGDLTQPGKEGRTMNAFYASQFLGMAFGPLLGGTIGSQWSYQAAFYVMGALSLLSLVLVWTTVPTDPITRRRKKNPKPKTAVPLRRIVGHDAVKASLIYVATRGFWRQSFNTFYPLFATTMVGIDEARVGIILSSYMFAEGILQIPFGFLADRYPRVRQIVVGSVFAPFVLLALPFVQSTVGVVIITFAMGAFSALGRSSLVAIRTELGRTYGMATLAGLQGSSFAAGQMIGPMASGLVVDVIGLTAIFPLSAIVGGVGTVLVLSWLRRWLRNDPDAPAMARQLSPVDAS